MKNEITNIKTYWIAHNSANVFHIGVSDKGQVTTGQPHLETFETKEDFFTRLNELGVDYNEEDEQWQEV